MDRAAEPRAQTLDVDFRSVFDGLPALVTLMDPQGALELANAQVLDYFGASLEQLKGWANGASFLPEDYPGVTAAWAHASATEEAYDHTARQRRADGVYRWVRTRGAPLRGPQGDILHWYFVQVDVDDAKRDALLLSGEKRLLEMVATGHPLTDVLTALCRLVRETEVGCYCSIILVDADGQRLEQCIAPDLPASFSEAIIGLPLSVDAGPCAMAMHLNVPVIAAKLDDEPRWGASGWRSMALAHGLRACWSMPIQSKAGDVLGAFAILFDEPKAPATLHAGVVERFTHLAGIAIERARTDAALKRSEMFLAEAQRLSSTGALFWRLPDLEITWSDEVYRIMELQPGTPVTLDLIRTRVHPDDVGPLFERLRSEAGDFESDHRLLMPDGSVKHMHMVARGGRDDQTGCVEYVAAIQDVTQRRASDDALDKVRSELAHLGRVTSLGALTASIAHEVNQPLSGIITNASTCLRLLAAEPPDVTGALETARRTIRDGNRAADVITRLRALFAREPAVQGPVDLNEAARDVLSLSLNELQRGGVIVRTQFARNLPEVGGDRVQLQQVMLNLILNALEAMRDLDDRARELLIQTEHVEDVGVRFSVQDSGTGFEAGAAARLFEPFYTTKVEGMGMGLSISRTIIERHRGTLSAKANEDFGAIFSFEIPWMFGSRDQDGAAGAC